MTAGLSSRVGRSFGEKILTRLDTESIANLIEHTTGKRPEVAQSERAARTVAALTRTLKTTAAESLFDTEPDQLQATLVALADCDENAR
jgi:hypothetical protein